MAECPVTSYMWLPSCWLITHELHELMNLIWPSWSCHHYYNVKIGPKKKKIKVFNSGSGYMQAFLSVSEANGMCRHVCGGGRVRMGKLQRYNRTSTKQTVAASPGYALVSKDGPGKWRWGPERSGKSGRLLFIPEGWLGIKA